MSELRSCAKRFGGLAVTTFPRPVTRRPQGVEEPLKFCHPLEKYIGHSFNIFDIV